MNGRVDGEEGSFGAPSGTAAADILEKESRCRRPLCDCEEDMIIYCGIVC